jgi:hypothetical protein
MDATVTPLPIEETTPPVQKRYFVTLISFSDFREITVQGVESSAGRIGAKRRIETKRVGIRPRSLDFDTLCYSISARSGWCSHAPMGWLNGYSIR